MADVLRSDRFARYRLRHKAKLKERKHALRALKEVIRDAAKSVPCVDCGGKFPSICMDFDHVRGEKVDDVSKIVQRTYSVESLKAEIAKCDVVCANCHRLRTQSRRLSQVA